MHIKPTADCLPKFSSTSSDIDSKSNVSDSESNDKETGWFAVDEQGKTPEQPTNKRPRSNSDDCEQPVSKRPRGVNASCHASASSSTDGGAVENEGSSLPYAEGGTTITSTPQSTPTPPVAPIAATEIFTLEANCFDAKFDETYKNLLQNQQLATYRGLKVTFPRPITTNHVNHFCELLNFFPNMISLDMSNNKIWEAKEEVVYGITATILTRHPNLASLNLSNTGIGDATYNALRQLKCFIQELNNLNILDLSCNFPKDNSSHGFIQEFVTPICAINSLTSLNLRQSIICDGVFCEDAKAALSNISNLLNLTSLNLSGNKIDTDDAWEDVVSVLNKLPNIVHLDLSSNAICEASKSAIDNILAPALLAMKGLTTLNLSNNYIGDYNVDGGTVVDVSHTNDFYTDIDNYIGDYNVDGGTEVDVSHTNDFYTDIGILHRIVNSAPNLTSLDLSGNCLGELSGDDNKAFNELLQKLSKRPNFTTLNLKGNGFLPDKQAHIKNMFAQTSVAVIL